LNGVQLDSVKHRPRYTRLSSPEPPH
jgi:hypothetical protein